MIVHMQHFFRVPAALPSINRLAQEDFCCFPYKGQEQVLRFFCAAVRQQARQLFGTGLQMLLSGTCLVLVLGTATVRLRPASAPPEAASPAGFCGAAAAPYSAETCGECCLRVSAARLHTWSTRTKQDQELHRTSASYIDNILIKLAFRLEFDLFDA